MGCVPDPPTPDQRTADLIIVTKFDPSFDFRAPSTFAIVPTVTILSGSIIDAGNFNPAAGQEIIDRIVENMVSRGYTQTTKEALPDLGIDVTALVQFQAAAGASAGFWWGVTGYPTLPPYWGYPTGSYYAPWAYSTVAWKSGTLLIELVDLRGPRLKGATADGGAVLVEEAWAGILHGTLALDASPGAQVLSAIDQAFAQSPYLDKR
jgi:hypothetical protein